MGIFFQVYFSQEFQTGTTGFEKVTQEDEYQNFLLKKKFFIHLIFYLLTDKKKLVFFFNK